MNKVIGIFKRNAGHLFVFLVAVFALYWVLSRKKSAYPKAVQDKLDGLKKLGIDKVIVTRKGTDQYIIRAVPLLDTEAKDMKMLGFVLEDETKPDSDYICTVSNL